jgi:hypothetical protein
MKNVFVFAVCGSEEHTETLNFALEKLKKFSKSDIIVVTDYSRNEKSILHDQIINVETPREFDNHQASIYLKTGLFKFLPNGNNYCYLDSDVVAINSNCDSIFKELIAPIRFAPDHCKIPLFSPSAVNCGCQSEAKKYNDLLNEKLDLEDPFRTSSDKTIKKKRKELEEKYWRIKSNYTTFVKVATRYVFSFKEFRLTSDLRYNKRTKIWSDADGNSFMRTPNMRKLTKDLGLKWSFFNPVPRLKDGRSIWRIECKHLPAFIKQKFGIEVSDTNWQHWNGGVFLFNDQSHAFLDTWHQLTLSIFQDEKWKTRDQGTLIATVWKFGLNNHPTLPKKWNLLADYYNPNVQWLDGWKIRVAENEVIEPVFVHVYHHFFDKNWLLWQKIEEL